MVYLGLLPKLIFTSQATPYLSLSHSLSLSVLYPYIKVTESVCTEGYRLPLNQYERGGTAGNVYIDEIGLIWLQNKIEFHKSTENIY